MQQWAAGRRPPDCCGRGQSLYYGGCKGSKYVKVLSAYMQHLSVFAHTANYIIFHLGRSRSYPFSGLHSHTYLQLNVGFPTNLPLRYKVSDKIHVITNQEHILAGE